MVEHEDYSYWKFLLKYYKLEKITNVLPAHWLEHRRPGSTQVRFLADLS
jgi:hypothetical protein